MFKTHWCPACRTVRIPKDDARCKSCRTSVRIARQGQSKSAPRRCGRSNGTFGGCGGFVPAGGRCDRCGQ